MAITDLKNIENINLRTETKGQLIESKDLNIFKSSAAVISQFGQSKNDVIEFRLYDKANNLLTQKDNKKVKYIKYIEFNNYLKTGIDSNGEKVYSVDIEKLILDSGNGNGEYRVSLNFVKNKLGTDNETEKVWIEEISPSRKEIRVLPLLKDGSNYNSIIEKRYKSFGNNTAELRSSVSKVTQKIDSIQLQITKIIDDYFTSKYGLNYVDTIKKDFGINNNWDFVKTKILTDFKESLLNQINGKEYKLGAPSFGSPINQKLDFDEYEEFTPYIQQRLTEAIDYNLKYFVETKFPPSVQEEINNSDEVKLLESLIEKPLVSKSIIEGKPAVRKLPPDTLMELLKGVKKVDGGLTIDVTDPATGKQITIKATTPEELASKISDIKPYKASPNDPALPTTNPARKSIQDTISAVNNKIDETKQQINDAINKANELKEKGTKAIADAQAAANKIAGLKDEALGKIGDLKGKADELKGKATEGLNKVKGLLKKPKKKIGQSKFKIPKIF
jgi:peptidoglycan hydrolase CwlO-like protein